MLFRSHLRVSEEAEMIGLDLDQFMDEQIGDWSINEHHATYHGHAPNGSSQNSVHPDSGIPATKGEAKAE